MEAVQGLVHEDSAGKPTLARSLMSIQTSMQGGQLSEARLAWRWADTDGSAVENVRFDTAVLRQVLRQTKQLIKVKGAASCGSFA